jgi:hypothetical protein
VAEKSRRRALRMMGSKIYTSNVDEESELESAWKSVIAFFLVVSDGLTWTSRENESDG